MSYGYGVLDMCSGLMVVAVLYNLVCERDSGCMTSLHHRWLKHCHIHSVLDGTLVGSDLVSFHIIYNTSSSR